VNYNATIFVLFRESERLKVRETLLSLSLSLSLSLFLLLLLLLSRDKNTINSRYTFRGSQARLNYCCGRKSPELFPSTRSPLENLQPTTSPYRTSRRDNVIIIINATAEVSALESETARARIRYKLNSRISIFEEISREDISAFT